MAKVNISSNSSLVMNGNWSPALQATFNSLKATGGEIYFDNQLIRLDSGLSLLSADVNIVPFRITGGHSNRILVNCGPSQLLFYTGNTLNLLVDNLIFSSTDANMTNAANDCTGVLGGSYTELISVENCVFAGLSASNTLIYSGVATDLSVRNSKFGGCIGGEAVIRADANGTTVIDGCDFIDYQNLQGKYYSKTGFAASTNWIKATANDNYAALGATTQTVQIKNCRFDEGAICGIYCKNNPFVEIENCGFNVSSTTPGVGIKLENVKYATIKYSNFGYTNQDRPAIKLINCGNVRIEGVTSDHGVKRIEVDKASLPGLEIIHSNLNIF
jgi:hypothetical protein